MANKRMFSKDIVGSDAFQDMPVSSQLLYFQLGMEADDDGFIGNPKKIARSIGVAEDDMKILVAKRFVIIFSSGVLVIKHHRINNNWDKYNCKRTMYLEEFSQLCLKENKAYTTDITQGIPVQSENSLKTVFRIEENRREENTILPITEDKIKETLNSIPSKEETVFNYLMESWNVAGCALDVGVSSFRNSSAQKKLLPCCRKFTPHIKKYLKKILQDYTQEDIQLGIENYIKEILNRDPASGYAIHRFSFHDFIKQENGFVKFYNK